MIQYVKTNEKDLYGVGSFIDSWGEEIAVGNYIRGQSPAIYELYLKQEDRILWFKTASTAYCYLLYGPTYRPESLVY